MTSDLWAGFWAYYHGVGLHEFYVLAIGHFEPAKSAAR